MPPTHIRLPCRLAAAAMVLALPACTDGSAPVAAPPTTIVQASSPTTPPPTTPAATIPAATTPPPIEAPTSVPVTPAAPATVVSRGDPGRRLVALTFDAGADVGYTAQILDELDRSTVRATFGITGRWAQANPELVRRIAAAGHLLMNHSYDHRSFTGISARPAVVTPDERRADIERADEAIAALTGRTTRPWFRPPYGDDDGSLNAAVGALGYRYNVLWTVDSLGWRGLSAAAITARCLEGAVPGAILLLHVGSASQDAAALPGIVAGLRQRGYELGTVADLVAG